MPTLFRSLAELLGKVSATKSRLQAIALVDDRSQMALRFARIARI